MIKLKGMHDSMIRCIISEELACEKIADEFKKVVSKGQGVLPGCKVVLDFGARPVDRDMICSVLRDFVFPAGINVAAWITYDASSIDGLKRAGLPTGEPMPEKKGEDRSTPAFAHGLFLHRTLRSGQRVEHPGDVIIDGHVNGGAEIMASGNVTVLGRLRGLVHAGCDGREDTAVVARSMEAPQIRIGGRVGSLGKSDAWWGKSVIARVDDGVVLIDYWPAMKNEKSEEPA